MMDGEVILELTSADISGALDTLMKENVELLEVSAPEGLSVRFRIRRRDMKKVEQIAEKRGESLRRRVLLGAYWKRKALFRHWILIVGLVVLLILTAWLPTKVLFVRVEGNEYLPERLILEEASRWGIVFGADRGAVRSEQVKNALLDAIPQLQWAGINTVGCTAIISVEERTIPQEAEPEQPGNIVAVCDAVIDELTAVQGTAVKKVGQAVRTGEMLISGYTDCGGVILFSGAKGEVYGRTVRQISAVTPEIRLIKTEEGEETKKISLIIGKNRINFYEDSGILDTGCVKMYSEYCLTLPGGLTLPVKLVVQTQRFYGWTESPLDAEAFETLLQDYAVEYLRTQMTAGQILWANAATDGNYYAGKFICREWIGRLVHEEIIQDYGENR